MKYHGDKVFCSSLYSLILLHFQKVPTRIVRQVTFNTQRQRYEFVDSPGTAIYLTYVICHENHHKCHLITNTNELKPAPLSTFPSSTEFVICKDRHLHVPQNKVEISEDESINSGINSPNIIQVLMKVKAEIVQSRMTQIDTNPQPWTVKGIMLLKTMMP